jgi:hypothetical protein
VVAAGRISLDVQLVPISVEDSGTCSKGAAQRLLLDLVDLPWQSKG